MKISGGAYTGPTEISYLFIDAGCIRATVKRLSKRYLDTETAYLDYSKLKGGHQKVFVYDAVPGQLRDEAQAEYDRRLESSMVEVRKIRALNGFHVQLGDLRGRVARQKKVDIQIAVDMLLHTFRRNMHKATLVAGDIDFVPLLEALVREGMFVTLWYPEIATDELVCAADSQHLLSAATLGAALTRPDGTPLSTQFSFNNRLTHGVNFDPNLWTRYRWQVMTEAYELSQGPNGIWQIERFDPLASATSLQAIDTSLRALAASAFDQHGIEIPDSVWSQIHGET